MKALDQFEDCSFHKKDKRRKNLWLKCQLYDCSIFLDIIRNAYYLYFSVSTYFNSCTLLWTLTSLVDFLFQNATWLSHPVNIFVRRKPNLYIHWDRFKRIGDSQFFEVITTSKEIMSFHDHGVVVLRFGRSRNELSGNIALYYLFVKRRLCLVSQVGVLS